MTPEIHGAAKIILIVILLVFILSALVISNIVSDTIPKKITDRLKELNIQLLDGQYTTRDLAFHRFARPDYLGELKRINAVKKDGVLTECLSRRSNLLVLLTIFGLAVAAAAVFFFSIKIR